MHDRVLPVALSVALGLLAAGDCLLAQEQPVHEIVQVTEHLYRATNNNHHTAFLVTSDGIVIADPINPAFAQWLKGELGNRFNLPVRYVVYSHHHWDHASGGKVFDDTAIFVGHENMLQHLAMPPADTPLSAAADGLDRNRDGRLQLREANGSYADRFLLFDADGDGEISGAEDMRGPINAVRSPDVTYTDRMTITLGDQTTELLFPGIITHTDDMSIVHFPGERAIFVVDWISPRRLPYRTLGTDRLDGWLNALRLVENMDYDHVIGGHGVIGDKADVKAYRAYLEELRDKVAEGIAAGRTLEELQASIRMENYASWASYDDFRTLNIEGMYRMLAE